MTDVVALGEFLIDMVATQKNVSLFDAPSFVPKAGGAPANVIVGVRRLGKTAAFVGKVGRDDFGRGLRRTMEAEGVDTRALLDDAELPTTLAFVALSDKGDPAFSFFQGAHTNLSPADLPIDLIRSARIFHFGSVCLVNEPVRSATWDALRIAKEAGVIVSYDINWRPFLWPDRDPGRAIAPLALADFVKMNEAELQLVTGEMDVQKGLEKLETPASLVVVTLGEKGCMYRFDGKIRSRSAPHVSEVVDGTGAGDAFMAAMLADLRFPLEEDYLARLTRRACQAGAITVTRRGAIPSLPYAKDLDPL